MPETTPSITFIQHHVPALESGDYRIETTQTVTAHNTLQATYAAQQSFYVSGKRYSLMAGDVNSVYPPLGSAGQFASTLPHIVLNSSSLPWQRSSGSTRPSVNGNKAPWLALLLFDESEGIGAPQQVTLGDLRTYNEVFFPPRTAEPGENDAQPVNVIDVPLNLFWAIVPGFDEIEWLAHVRQVNVSTKTTDQDQPANDTLSVVISNRLPALERLSTMHLVSIENYAPYLPDAWGYQAMNFPPGTSLVRLVSLYSWSFRTAPQQESFAGLLLSVDEAPLQLPFTNNPEATEMANQNVQQALGLGYTALNHQLRNGDRTVSWYRGPLLPVATPQFLVPPYATADELMRYDPQTGLMDASYAGAWQLGKLMALRDNAYAQTLVRWKATQTQNTVNALEAAIINEHLGVGEQELLVQPEAKQARMTAAIHTTVAPAAQHLRTTSNS